MGSTKKRFAAVVSMGALLMVAVPLFVTAASADPNPLLAKGNGHPRLSNGKGVAHFSGAVEATYDERAERSDLQAGASDAPPDVTVSALGCANRGSETNHRLNQDCTLRRQAEEQVVVNPTDPNNVIAGQNDSRVGFNHCGFDYSLDAGRTWGDGQPPFFQHLSPVGHTYDAASDPAVTFDGTGRAWYSCVLFDLNDAASAVAVAPSTPGLKGSAYSNIGAGPSPFIAAEAGDASHGYDKEFIAADRRPVNTEVYVTFTDFQSNPNCVRSNNRGGLCQSAIYLSKWTGSHFTAPLEISGSAPFCTQGNQFNKKFGANACNFDQGSFPVVLSDGSVYVVFSNFNTPTLVNQQLGVHVSSDLSTVSAPVKVGVDDETNTALCDFGRGPEGCVDSLHIRTQDFPALAADPGDPSHLVATWQDTRASNGSGNYDIVVSESHDGGATWSDRNGHGTVLTTGGAYFQPSVAISAPSSHIVVSAYHANTALHGAHVGDGTYGYGYLVDAGSGFGAYTPASDGQAYPSPQGNATQAGFLGDYSSTAAGLSGNIVYMVWADTRNSSSLGPDEDVFVFFASI